MVYDLLIRKHIARKKKGMDGKDDESYHITIPLGDRVVDEIIDIPDRSITFNKELIKTPEEAYRKEAIEVKDDFLNTAQYIKFVNAHLAEKKSKIKKLNEAIERFDREVAALKSEPQKTKEDLDLIHYKNIRPEDVKKVLTLLDAESNAAKAKLDHFNAQAKLAQKQLMEKNEQINDVESELKVIEKKFSSKDLKEEKEEGSIENIQKELNSIDSKDDAGKIFGAINSLAVLLNSKNQATLDELNSVKSEFNKMKQEYDKALKKLKEKNE